jgi:hypothetical protein
MKNAQFNKLQKEAIEKLLYCIYWKEYASKETDKIVTDKNFPETLKGFMITSLWLPIGIIISTDPLLSLCKDDCYKMLFKTKNKINQEVT